MPSNSNSDFRSEPNWIFLSAIVAVSLVGLEDILDYESLTVLSKLGLIFFSAAIPLATVNLSLSVVYENMKKRGRKPRHHAGYVVDLVIGWLPLFLGVLGWSMLIAAKYNMAGWAFGILSLICIIVFLVLSLSEK